jgi:hypothetical protein
MQQRVPLLIGFLPQYDCLWYDALVNAEKFSISFEAELVHDVRTAAARAGKPLSAWLAEAAAAKLRSEALEQFLDEWEERHGPITADELSRAESELGFRKRKRSR